MARPWGEVLADVPSDYVITPFDCKNRGAYNTPFTDNALSGGAPGTFTVPASTPYKRVLQFSPQPGTLSITLNGVAATFVKWPNAPPTAGVVSVNYISGELAFNAADTGKAVVAIYRHFGTTLDSFMLMAMLKTLSTLGQADSIPKSAFISGVPVAGNRVHSVLLHGHGRTSMKLKTVGISCHTTGSGGAGSGTTFRVTTSGTSTGGATVTLGLGQTEATADVNVTIDTTNPTWIRIYCDDNGAGFENLTVWMDFE